MTNCFKNSIVSVAIFFMATSGFSIVEDPEMRRAKIEIATRLLSKGIELPDKVYLAAIGDPFGVAVEEPIELVEEVEEVSSPQELIPLLANSVNPTGIFEINGEYYLMFKEDKLKSGSEIDVVYRNKQYNLEIVKILRNAYSLRLEDAELEIKLK